MALVVKLDGPPVVTLSGTGLLSPPTEPCCVTFKSVFRITGFGEVGVSVGVGVGALETGVAFLG